MALVISSEEKVVGCYVHQITFYPPMKIPSSFMQPFSHYWQEEMMIVNFFQPGPKSEMFLFKEFLL